MSKKENYEAKAEELLKPIAEANHVEIYDVEYVKEGSEWYLRSYILEVSSPGLGRTLKKDKHLRKSLLEEVEVKTYKPIMGKKEFTGILKAFDEDTVTLGAALKEGIEDIIFDRKDIAVIKLTLDF